MLVQPVAKMLRHSHEKNNLSRFKSLLVTGLWDITLTFLLPPTQSCSSKFWAWSYIVSNFAKRWRGDNKHKIMDRPLIPKYGTPFPCANSTRACSDHLTFTELTLLAKPKVFIRRKVGPPCRVTRLGESPFSTSQYFCFSCKQFAKFCKKMYEKLAGRG